MWAGQNSERRPFDPPSFAHTNTRAIGSLALSALFQSPLYSLESPITMAANAELVARWEQVQQKTFTNWVRAAGTFCSASALQSQKRPFLRLLLSLLTQFHCHYMTL